MEHSGNGLPEKNCMGSLRQPELSFLDDNEMYCWRLASVAVAASHHPQNTRRSVGHSSPMSNMATADYQLINVNITSSSPPEEVDESCVEEMPPILRTNSARQSRTSGQRSRKSSTITFAPEQPIIKRPNSTIGIPSSVIQLSNSSIHKNATIYNNVACVEPCSTSATGSATSSNFNLPIGNNAENALPVFTPIVREKAASLTLQDPKALFLRKGVSNPFLTTKDSTVISPGQYSLPGGQRTSIILNGNILHSISPIHNSQRSTQIAVPTSGRVTGSSSVNFAEGTSLRTSMTSPGTAVATPHRSSYIDEEENYNLHKQYLTTSGRKDTIISIGKNFQIQFKSPSTSGLAWRYRTKLEKFLLISFLISAIVLLSALYIPFPGQEDLNPKICTTMECVRTSASLLSAMDLNADPCEDFFQFACGTWVKKHVIPEDRASLSTFEVMADDLQIILKDLLEQTPNSGDNSATLKAKRFYQSCMSIQKIESIGVAPIRQMLEDVGQWPVLDKNWDPHATHYIKRTEISSHNSPTTGKSKQSERVELSLESLLGKIRGDFNQPVIVEQYVGPDDRNSSHNIIQFDQTSLGLPSRDYFLRNQSQNEKRDAYLDLMIDVAELLGAPRDYAREQMLKVLEFETELANATMPEADRHDTSAIYNRKTIRELNASVPEFNWFAYLENFMPVEVSMDDPVVVYSIEYYKKMGKILERTMREDARIVYNYAIWRLLKSLLPFLDGEFGVRRAKFRKVLLGISADRTRWSQCVELVNKKMGMAVGALFIRDNFDPRSKEIAIEMIHNIRQAFNELLNYNEWMDDEMRKVANEKANAINERIGYPELLTNPIELSKEYNFLEVHDETFLANIIAVFRFESLKNLIKLGTQVDKDSWTTDPAVVNAFYSPNKNDIVFPAGILQPLFYSHYFPKSLNYGGIGVVIGHEITHGFDDRGRQFDKDGNMKQWWNNATIKKFRVRAQCIIDQYSSYVLEDINTNVDGRMTQGENIADNGGLKQAYRAFKQWEHRNGQEPRLPGLNLTHDQLFFLNYAQIWCGSMRPEDALNKISSSVHSPGPIRVLGPLSNSLDFSRAYKCPVGSRMNPIKKCTVW